MRTTFEKNTWDKNRGAVGRLVSQCTPVSDTPRILFCGSHPTTPARRPHPTSSPTLLLNKPPRVHARFLCAADRWKLEGRWKTAIKGGRRGRGREEVKGNRENEGERWQLWGPLRTKDEPPVDSVSNESGELTEEKQKCCWNKGERPAQGKKGIKNLGEGRNLLIDFVKVKQRREREREKKKRVEVKNWVFFFENCRIILFLNYF